MDLLQPLAAILSGALVGFTLGLIGGGGSIMATPLLLYVVGLQPHVAIGTGALAVSVNSFINFGGHARAGHVRWRSAILFAVVGVVGAVAGSSLGGGFLIVPGLLFATGMPMLFAVGSSLLAVGSFGLTTAVNYAVSGLINWPVAAEYIAGGVVGGLLGMRLCAHLAPRKAALNQVFAALVFVVAGYMLYRNLGALPGSQRHTSSMGT